MNAITVKQLRGTFAMTVRAAQGAGIDTSHWTLVEGSATYSYAYRIADVDPQTGGQSTPKGMMGGNLGYTRREAMSALSGMREAFYAVEAATRYRCGKCGMTASTDDLSVIGRNCSASDFNDAHEMALSK